MADEERQNAPVENRETVVVDKNGGGPGTIVAVIIGLVVLALIIWLVAGVMDTTEDTTPDTTIPNELDVNVETP